METVENHGFCCSASFTTPVGVPVLDVRPIRAISPFAVPPQRAYVSEHCHPFGYTPPQPQFSRVFSRYPIFDEAEVRRKLEQDIALRANRQQKSPAVRDFPGNGINEDGSESIQVGNIKNHAGFEKTEVMKSTDDLSLKNGPDTVQVNYHPMKDARPEFQVPANDLIPENSGGCSGKIQARKGKISGADGQYFSVGNERNIFPMKNAHTENQQNDLPLKNEQGENLHEGSTSAPKLNAQPAIPKAEYVNPGEFLSQAKMHGGNIRAEQPSQTGRPSLPPEANTQSGNAMGLMGLCNLNTLQQNAKDLRSAFAKSLKRFKDLTVLEPGSTPETYNNITPVETQTITKKRKRSSKGTTVYSATDKDKITAGDDRKLVRKTRMIYDALRRSLSGEDEPSKELATRRPDLKAGTLMRDKGLWINRDRRIIGPVPGVHVGDQFYFRMELCIIGLHGQIQAGIDYITANTAKTNQLNDPLAISIIASGGYEDNEDGGDVLIYTGQGGNNYKLDRKQTVDQKLERGNLALERSMHYRVDIRVIRGIKDGSSPSGKIYIYDGLYRIQDSWLDKGRSGCGVFKYRLQRTPGQPELGSAVVKSTGKWRSEPLSRPGIFHLDISSGAEKLPVCLVNSTDSDKGPAHFEYIGKLRYLNTVIKPEPSQGCNCTAGCSSGDGCSCALRNGGELPYKQNGILRTGKPLIYECGDWCRCPPTCRNRVSQKGLKHRLEVFRTRERGWGVRSWDSIPPGAFVCEYIGEVVPAAEGCAERRPEDGEYLLSAIHFRERWREWDVVSDILSEQNLLQAAAPCEESLPLGFTIDARRMGNVARFVNHCCSPNVTVQFVLHDHHDIRFPHAMLFALENIPPLTELTLDYGRCYQGQSRACLCGASDGNGRMSRV